MKTLLVLVHLVVSFALITVILLQQRKQGGFSGIFGGGTQADMAGQWQRFTALTKATVLLASVFIILSLVLVVSHS